MDVSANGGQLHMETSGTSNAMGELIAAQTALATSWGSVKGAIGALDGKLGKGPLGAAFAAKYNKPADQVTQDLTGLPGEIQAQADVGRTCVIQYIEADLRGKQGLSDALRPPTATG